MYFERWSHYLHCTNFHTWPRTRRKTHSSNIISCESVARASENIGPFSAQNRACSEASSHPIKLRPHLGLHFLPLFRISTSKSSGDLRHKRAEGKPNYSYRDICEREVGKNAREGTFLQIIGYLALLCYLKHLFSSVLHPHHIPSASHPLSERLLPCSGYLWGTFRAGPFPSSSKHNFDYRKSRAEKCREVGREQGNTECWV